MPKNIAIACFLLTGCTTDTSESIHILRIDGISWAGNMTTSYGWFGSTIESEDRLEVVLPASRGDLLYMAQDEDILYLRYTEEYGDTLSVSFDSLSGHRVFLNGSLAQLNLTSEVASWEILLTPDEKEAKRISTIFITDSITDTHLSLLNKARPFLKGRGLVLDASLSSDQLLEVLTVLEPAWLVTENLPPAVIEDSLNPLSQLELLCTQDEASLVPWLPGLKNLQSLCLSDWDPGSGEVLELAGLETLHSLTLAESGIRSLDQLALPPSLKSLYLVACDTLTSLTGLAGPDRLHALGFMACDEITGIGLDPDQTKSLRYMAFPGGCSQETFTGLISGMPSLEMAEILECEHIVDLTPLEELSHLRVLSTDMVTQRLGNLSELTQVQLIILDTGLFDEDPEWISGLRSSMPETTIVPGTGLCMGSGWILLLFPMILCFRWMMRHSKWA